MIPGRTEDEIRQNLKDAGCGNQMIARCMEAVKAGDGQRCARLLEDRRRALLDRIHGEEKKLSCLDYLRYQLRKNQRQAGAKRTAQTPEERRQPGNRICKEDIP